MWKRSQPALESKGDPARHRPSLTFGARPAGGGRSIVLVNKRQVPSWREEAGRWPPLDSRSPVWSPPSQQGRRIGILPHRKASVYLPLSKLTTAEALRALGWALAVHQPWQERRRRAPRRSRGRVCAFCAPRRRRGGREAGLLGERVGRAAWTVPLATRAREPERRREAAVGRRAPPSLASMSAPCCAGQVRWRLGTGVGGCLGRAASSHRQALHPGGWLAALRGRGRLPGCLLCVGRG